MLLNEETMVISYELNQITKKYVGFVIHRTLMEPCVNDNNEHDNEDLTTDMKKLL